MSSPDQADLKTEPSFRDHILPKRHIGRWVLSVVVLAVVALVIFTFARAKISWPAVGSYIVAPQFLSATLNVLLLAVISLAASVVIGLLVTLMRTSKSPIASAIAWFYVWIFRGVPLLLQLVIWYNFALLIPRVTVGIPFTSVVFFDESTNVVMTPLLAAFLGLALCEAAYVSELIRGSLKSVDVGQGEAAAALGMSPARILRRIVLPQAMKSLIPPMGNQFIGMLKATSLASLVTYPELVYVAQGISALNLQVIETLFASAFWYMVLITGFSIIQYFIERKFDAGVLAAQPRSFGKVWLAGIVPWISRGRAKTASQPALVEGNNNV